MIVLDQLPVNDSKKNHQKGLDLKELKRLIGLIKIYLCVFTVKHVSPELLLTVFTAETVFVQNKFICQQFFHRIDGCQAGRAHFPFR